MAVVNLADEEFVSYGATRDRLSCEICFPLILLSLWDLHHMSSFLDADDGVSIKGSLRTYKGLHMSHFLSEKPSLKHVYNMC